jgi:hypothetical protein
MTIPDKNLIIKLLSDNFGCTFSPVRGKQIMYQGVIGRRRIVVCTPSSRIHAKGHGWFDLTVKQVKLLDGADVGVLAVRLEGNKVYYVNFEELRKLMTPDNLHVNQREGEHWKFYVWDNYSEVRGNNQKLSINPKVISAWGL